MPAGAAREEEDPLGGRLRRIQVEAAAVTEADGSLEARRDEAQETDLDPHQAAHQKVHREDRREGHLEDQDGRQ